MKILALLTVSVLILFFSLGCKKKETINILKIDSISVYKDIKLMADSLRIKLGQGDSAIVQTNKGSLKIILIDAFKSCPLLGCGTCDLSAEIKVKFVLDGISYTPKPKDIFETVDCLKKDLPVDIMNNCKDDYSKNYWLPTKSLLFRVRFFTPYPETTQDLMTIYNHKLYQIDLHLQNSCKN